MEGTYLAHHGVKGQKWGVRNYQNPDGSLTAAGKKRYSGVFGKSNFKKDGGYKELDSKLSKNFDEYESSKKGKKTKSALTKSINKMYDNDDWDKDEELSNDYMKKYEAHYKAAYTYAGQKLVKEYGSDVTGLYASIVSGKKASDGEEAVNRIVDRFWDCHME